ncbi:rhodanese-like domain-containing protein [Alkalibacterium olivapovliticus]|uniref:Rhodanese-related sulfurtransferase n=1 Tax=Alkalibacterium olivapovliticus TaxID=99907 RepID=A0A2T0W6F6_9LACT|nr:rhodanese-like domain-containing protein [Alkalibacterium olivapovliticus]PRY82297.1 rhodanese-related sulfurtransferase [Alkalibacterium olivapovliticus]
MFGLFKSIPSVNTAQLEAELRNKPMILDVRTPGEYRVGHIPGAKNVPLNTIEQYQGKKQAKLYVVCQSGMRSKRVASSLKKKGYEVVNVRGGMSQWSGHVRGGTN